MRAVDNSAENRYIQNVTLNGREHAKPYVDFADIAAGGEMIFTMGDKPALWY
jgi:putative alpha-1,2-mannosidase